MSQEAARGPLGPGEVREQSKPELPEQVFEVFNDLIARNLHNGRATVLQKDAVKQLVAQGFTRKEIFARQLLDVEERYRSAGWRVVFDRPVYWGGEDFEPYFEFTDPSVER